MSGRPLRILLTTDLVGGVWSYTVTLANALAARGHALLVAVVGEMDASRATELSPGIPVEAKPLRLEWMRGGSADQAVGAEWLATLVREWGADLIHLNQFSYAAFPLGAPTLVVGHSDVLSWWSEVRGATAPAEWERYAAQVRRGLEAADLVVTPSRYQSRLLERHYGRGADRVVPNGVDVSDPEERREEGRETSILTAGRAWDPAKDVATLDAALGILGDDAPPAVLLGDTTDPEGGDVSFRRLRVEGRRPPAEVRARMRRSALYVAASRYEPFGLAPLEAALEGCALLLSHIGSFRELWDGCAAFFPPGDAQALAAEIRRLEGDPPRRRELAEAAGRRARERFGVERTANEYLDLYRTLIPAHAPVMHPTPTR